MAKCSRCGERDLLNSDLCGDYGCIYCMGVDLSANDRCVDCGKSLEGVSSYISAGGARCFDCHKSK